MNTLFWGPWSFWGQTSVTSSWTEDVCHAICWNSFSFREWRDAMTLRKGVFKERAKRKFVRWFGNLEEKCEYFLSERIARKRGCHTTRRKGEKKKPKDKGGERKKKSKKKKRKKKRKKNKRKKRIDPNK